MHKEILSPEQAELVPFLKSFKREFYLVGGTAIALYIGHRRSIDFDFFKLAQLHPKSILNKIKLFPYPYVITRRVTEQINLTMNQVKFTFYQYPFSIEAVCEFEKCIRLPSLIDLAAMKAYALGRRSKWKDYFDLYFLLKEHFTIKQISERANQLFQDLFLEKLFRAQLCFFNDIDFSESVEFLLTVPPEKEIRDFLIEKAIDLDQ